MPWHGSDVDCLHFVTQFYHAIPGPCIGLDTACSSSLITTHLAANALADGEAESALSAGINIMLSPVITAAICQLQVSCSEHIPNDTHCQLQQLHLMN